MSYEQDLIAFNAAVTALTSAVTTLDTTATSSQDTAVALSQSSASTASTAATTATNQANIATAQAVIATQKAQDVADGFALISGGPVTSVGGATGVVVLKTVNSNVLTGAGNIDVQSVLVSGTNVKTVNSSSLLGSGNLAVGDVTLAGVQSLTNKTITDIVFALTGTTPAFSATNGGVQTWTLSGVSTPTNSLTTGQSIILVITPGANTITWPSTTWTKVGGSGAAPTLFSAGKTTVVLWMVGSTLYGSHLGDTV